MEEMIGRLDEIAGSLERIACALEELVRTAKEGKETFPPNTPYKEKGEGQTTTDARVRVREGFIAPDCGMVISFAATLGIGKECAEEFWNYYEALGWMSKGSPVRNWRPLLKAWHSAHRRFDARDERRTAHIDAKMDEREARRERRAGGGRRKADNNVEMSDEVREEVRRDFTF